MEILKNSFRPQQGLTIMNPLRISHSAVEEVKGFRPQQGLTIMNCRNVDSLGKRKERYCFRPQQGLTIMNKIKIFIIAIITGLVSVPNRG